MRQMLVLHSLISLLTFVTGHMDNLTVDSSHELETLRVLGRDTGDGDKKFMHYTVWILYTEIL